MEREVVKRILGDKPVAYHPVIAKILGSACSALYFSQMMYWDSTLEESRNGWFWKTQEEMHAETGLSRSEQETARRELKKHGWINEKKQGIPYRLWYRVEWDAFLKDVAANQSAGNQQTSLQNPANQSAGNQQTALEKSDEKPHEIGNGTPLRVVSESTTESTREYIQPPSALKITSGDPERVEGPVAAKTAFESLPGVEVPERAERTAEVADPMVGFPKLAEELARACGGNLEHLPTAIGAARKLAAGCGGNPTLALQALDRKERDPAFAAWARKTSPYALVSSIQAEYARLCAERDDVIDLDAPSSGVRWRNQNDEVIDLDKPGF